MPPVALHQRQEVLLLSSTEVSQRSGGRQLTSLHRASLQCLRNKYIRIRQTSSNYN